MATPVKDGKLLPPFVYCVEVRCFSGRVSSYFLKGGVEWFMLRVVACVRMTALCLVGSGRVLFRLCPSLDGGVFWCVPLVFSSPNAGANFLPSRRQVDTINNFKIFQ